jgi:hypothetical protein
MLSRITSNCVVNAPATRKHLEDREVSPRWRYQSILLFSCSKILPSSLTLQLTQTTVPSIRIPPNLRLKYVPHLGHFRAAIKPNLVSTLGLKPCDQHEYLLLSNHRRTFCRFELELLDYRLRPLLQKMNQEH